jgi:hypothetical protein
MASGTLKIKLSMKCPEVNGFIARLEELKAAGELTGEEAREEIFAFGVEHQDCPTCKKEHNDEAAS